MRKLIVGFPEYYQHAFKPQNFEEFCGYWRASEAGPLGIWRVATIEKYSGAVLVEQWLKNDMTDYGALAGWRNLIAASGGAVPVFNNIAITTNAGVTTLTAQLTNGQSYTSISVAALPAMIPNGASVVIGAGTGQTQTVILTAQANQGATSLTVSGGFTANATYNVGANVAPLPNPGDNPSSLSGTVSYSGPLSSGAFTYSGAGRGNRQVKVSYTFQTPGAQTANNTEAWLCNAQPVNAINQTCAHVIFNSVAPINNTTGQIIDIVEKY